MKRLVCERVVRLAVVALIAVVLATAQSDRGAITGTVVDPTSAVVPGAKLVLRNTATGALSETVTTPTGNFTLAQIPVGDYDLSVEASGFKKATEEGIRVQVAQTIRLDIKLQLGATSESVNVTAEVSLLKSENAEQSMNISGDRLNALPLNFSGLGGGGNLGVIRSWTAFNILAPGVGGTGGKSEAARMNGLPSDMIKILVEGQDTTSANNPDWSGTMNQTSVEMVQEFSLQHSNYAAEFGQVGAGIYNFTTRSGTNQYHGSLYEYMANEALDASRAFTHERPKDRKHDFGFTVGGPLWIPKVYDGRNRTFFFFSWEMFRNRTVTASSLATVPTEPYRNGDFGAALTGRLLGTDPLGRAIRENTIYDPNTSRTVNGQIFTDPFPGNKIGPARLDPVALKVQALIPQPSNSEKVLNWLQTIRNDKIEAIPSIKIDRIISSSHKLSFYWSHLSCYQYPGGDGLPAPITASRYGPGSKISSHTTRINYDWTVTPTLLLHLGSGLNRLYNPDSAPPGVLNYNAVTGIGFRGSATSPSGFPRIAGLSQAQGGLSLGLGPTNANHYYDGKWTSIASATYIRGNHTYKLGGEFRIDSWTDRMSNGAQGILSFSADQTGLPATLGQLSGGGVGFPYASFLLGLVDNASVSAVQDPQWRKPGWALYLQDTWKVTRKFTLDYGLRWDYETQGHEIWWRNSMFGPTIPNPSAGGLPGGIVYEGYGPGRCNCTFTHPYPYAIGPRLGAAYQIDSKTVLRAGIGVTYANVAQYQYMTNSPILGVGFGQSVWANPGYGAPAAILQNGLPFNVADLYKVTLDPGLRPSPGQLDAPGRMFDRNGARPGRILQWNIGLQREVVRNLLVEAAYVGNRGVWLIAKSGLSLVDLNALSAEQLRSFGIDITNADDRKLLTSRMNSPLAQSRGIRLPYPGFPVSATVAQSLRPFPQFGSSLVPRWQPLGNSWYDSLQVKVTKRYSHGLDLTSAFTWAKDLALGPDSGGVNDVFNRPNQKALAGTSMPFIFVVGFNYQTPGVGSNKLVRKALGGWTLGGLLRYTSGLLIPVPASQNNLSTLLFQSTRMNRVPGEPLFLKDLNCHCIDPNKDFVLNPKAWTDAPPGQWGYSAPYYNDYRQARQPSESFNVGRMFRIRERMSFSIRAELFNAFNRMFLAAPNSSNPLATQTRNAQGVPTAGFGYIIANSSGTTPRNGQIVARFQF